MEQKNLQLKDRVIRDLISTYLKKGFEDEEDLYFYVEQILGYTIPRKSFCPEHTAPWNFVHDIYFELVRFCLAYGSRGSGKTFEVALINHLKMLYKQCSVEVDLASATLDQSDKGYAHFLGFFKTPFLGQLIENSIKSRTRLFNGSELIITSGTYKGLNGLHGNTMCCDEIEVFPSYDLLGEALSISMSKYDKRSKRLIPAQDIWSSTRKFSSGIMTRVLSEAEEKNMSVYTFCIWETVEKCTRLCKSDPNWGNCPIVDKCKGKAHDCDGWYPISDFIQKTVAMPKAQFEAQWENKSPSGGPKVFGSTWDENIHVLSWVGGGKFKTFESVFGHKEIPRHWRRIAGVDFGQNFAFGMIAIEPKYGIMILYHEYFYNKERTMPLHAQHVLNSPGIERVYRVFGDPSAKQGILDLNDLLHKKLRRKPIFPAMNALIEGVDEIKGRLELSPINNLPRFFCLDSCIEFRREMREWEHEVNPDGSANLESFEEGNDHSIDYTRYALYTYPRMPRNSYRLAAVDGI